jgi:hypothetical protein
MLRFCVVIGATVSLAMMLLAFEVMQWAAAYLHVGGMPGHEPAMIYSLGAGPSPAMATPKFFLRPAG